MRILYVLFLTALLSMALLWLGLYGRLPKRRAALGAACSLLLGGGLLLLAVLPGNSFYGPVLTHFDTHGRRLIALTFDDGPYPPYTQELLRLLAQKRVKATFFIVGSNAAAQPELVRAELAQGHQLALHCGQHQDLLKLDAQALAENIRYGQQTLRELTGVSPAYLRPPHGFKDWQVLSGIEAAGLRTVTWSIIPRDWTNPGAEVIADRVCEAAEPGAIVLLHDGDSPKMTAPRTQTIEATALIIDRLRAQGYEFVTLDELRQAAEQ